MIGAPRLRANLANARASTGPKTPSGKAHAAKNARKHGLAVPISCDATLSAEVEALARDIAGETAAPEMKTLVRRFVEAQVDVSRVRQARENLIATALGDPTYESRKAFKARAKLALDLSRRPADLSMLGELAKVLVPQPEGPNQHVMVLFDFAKRLAAFDRYERRALSRRKFSIRALDAAGFVWARAEVSKPNTIKQISVTLRTRPPTQPISAANVAQNATSNDARSSTPAPKIKSGNGPGDLGLNNDALVACFRDLDNYAAKRIEMIAATRIDLAVISEGAKLSKKIFDAAFNFLFERKFEAALSTIDRAMPAFSGDPVCYIFRAHALMFLDRTEEAQALYERLRSVRTNIGDEFGIDVIIRDFAAFRRSKLTHRLMDEFEKLPRPNARDIRSAEGWILTLLGNGPQHCE